MDSGQIRRVWLPLVLVIAVMIWLFRIDRGPESAAQWIGLGIAAIGLLGIFVSRYTLGRSFSVRAKATALVTTGIYSRIRNPIYVSGVIFLIGIAVMLSRPALLLLLLIIIPMQLWRVRREARVLEAKFGDEYREYRKRTWF
jgi:protein-S-isoprenylcysteine O-methyltransferase Ste14